MLCSGLAGQGQDLDSLYRVWQDKQQHDTLRLEALHTLAWKMAFSNPDSSLQLAAQELAYARKLGSLEDVISSLNTQGVASTIKGEYIDALDHYEEAIAIAKAEDAGNDPDKVFIAKKGLAQTYINRGILFKNQGDYSSALDNQLKSLALWEELGSERKMATAYGNIGVIYKYLGQPKQALDYQMKSVRLLKANNTHSGLATAYSNIALLHQQEGDLDSAMYYHNKSLELDISLDNQRGVSASYANLGNVHKQLGDYKTAIELQEKSLALDKAAGSKKGMAGSHVNLGQYYLGLGNHDEAIYHLNKALQLAQGIGSLKEQKFAQQWLSEVYEARGDQGKALHHYKEYVSLRDSLINVDTRSAVIRSEVQFEFAKKAYKDSLDREVEAQMQRNEQDRRDALKEAEITQQKRYSTYAIIGAALLLILLVLVVLQFIKQKRNNRLLVEQKGKIEKRDKEKEVLIREIHHRVKNNLQIISSLLRVEQRKSVSADVKEALSYSRQRIEAISMVHEKLYLQTDLANINLDDYLLDLAENLLVSYDKQAATKLQIQAPVLNLHADVAVNLGLLTAELITNSIKHAEVPEGGALEITLSLSDHNGSYLFAYADNGSGDADQETAEPTSFGMKLIHSIVKKMNGELKPRPDDGQGFRLHFTFKTAHDE